MHTIYYFDILTSSLPTVYGLAELSILGVQVYLKSWFSSQLPTTAPAIDLKQLKILSSLNSHAAKAALKKLCDHLWYLSEGLIVLLFFDSDDVLEKSLMVFALQKPASKHPPKRIAVNITNINAMQ
jgi:hypothetical protein